MSAIWNNFFIEPLSQALLFLTDTAGNLGVAIILLTVAIQLALVPLRLPSLRSAQKMKELKPDLDKLKKKHKDDPQKLVEAQMALYKEHGVSPFGGILPMLLSLPIIFALYRVLQTELDTLTDGVSFLWFNLTQPDPYYLLPIIVAISQWFLVKFSSQANAAKSDGGDDSGDMTAMMQKNMQFIFPLMLGFITLRLPSGVGIYFVVSAWFAIMQQVWIHKQSQKSNN